jgi:hypothetical protein
VHAGLRSDQILGVNLVSTFQLAAYQGLALGEVIGREGEDGAEVAEVDCVIDGCDIGEVEGEDVVVEGLKIVVCDDSLVLELQFGG